MNRVREPSSTLAPIVIGLAGALVAAGGAWVESEGTGSARSAAIVTAAGLGLSLGPPVALAWAAVARLGARPWAWAAARLGLAAKLTRDPSAARGPVIALHAGALGLAAAVALFALAFTVWLARLRRVQVIDTFEGLALGGALGLGAVSGAIGLATRAIAQRVLVRLDARSPLPLPAHPGARRVAWIAAPLAIASAWGVHRLGDPLGPLSAPLWLALVAAASVALSAIAAPLASTFTKRTAETNQAPPSRGLVAVAWSLGIGLAALGLTVAHRTLAASPAGASALASTPMGALALRVARAATDVDRDGASSLFGGADCAPLDARRGPGAREIPGDGRDDDCDGRDGEPGEALPRGPRYLDEVSKIPDKKPDIVWVVIDALRADHTSLLGYGKPTTPYLEELGREALVFANATSQSSATMLSFPSMLTGLDPARILWSLDGGRLQVDPSQPLLSERLLAAGYTTGFVSSAYFQARLPGLLRGWSWSEDTPMGIPDSSERAAAKAAKFVARATVRDEPFFLLAYLPGPHAPYHAHAEAYPAMGKGSVATYDVEIAASDRALGALLEVLRDDAARWENTIVVVVGDHGEEFREHGGTEHARTCFAESVHVPIVLKLPGKPAARVDTPAALVDLVPTLLEQTGLPRPADDALDGVSLRLVHEAPERLPKERPRFCSVLSQKATQGDFFRRAVRAGKWLYTKELRGAGEAALYDTEVDPRERSPLPLEGERAEVAARLDRWLALSLTGNLATVPLTGE